MLYYKRVGIRDRGTDMDAQKAGRRLVRWHCAKPGCDKSGIGYEGKKWCTTKHRVWGVRQRRRDQGYMRTRRGYVPIADRVSA